MRLDSSSQVSPRSVPPSVLGVSVKNGVFFALSLRNAFPSLFQCSFLPPSVPWQRYEPPAPCFFLIFPKPSLPLPSLFSVLLPFAPFSPESLSLFRNQAASVVLDFISPAYPFTPNLPLLPPLWDWRERSVVRFPSPHPLIYTIFFLKHVAPCSPNSCSPRDRSPPPLFAPCPLPPRLRVLVFFLHLLGAFKPKSVWADALLFQSCLDRWKD